MDGPATRRHLIQLAARLVPVENLLAGGDRPGISAICTPNPQLASLINGVEDRIAQVLGRREPVLVRTIQRVAELERRDPFYRHQGHDVHERCVTFLPHDQPWTGRLPLTSPRADVQVFAADGSDVFSTTCLVGGRPGTAGPLIERQEGARVTTRNWNTIVRILRSPA